MLDGDPRATSKVIDICSLPAAKEVFQHTKDEHVRNVLGAYGTVEGIYRWYSAQRRLHLLVELDSPASASAASKHTGPDQWTITWVEPGVYLHKEFCKLKHSIARLPQRPLPLHGKPPLGERLTSVPPSSGFGSPPLVHQSPIFNQPGGSVHQHGFQFWPTHPLPFPLPPQHPMHTFPFPFHDPTMAPIAPVLAPKKNTPDSASLRRSRDPDDDGQSLGPLKKLRREMSDILAQERLKYSELEKRAQAAEKKARAAEEREESFMKSVTSTAGRDARRHKRMQVRLRLAWEGKLQAEEKLAAREAELSAKCSQLEIRLEQTQQEKLAISKERDELTRMVDSAYLVPSLKNAFIQIDQLLRGLGEQPAT
ncbi:hypothetical protein BOTBODRAFT_27567 [Botryobasidium botryosum FD-172 SS1]|uniref:Uncharacterized protein n=1 Tax=Botryobasidium botryosum (strain FD-172 SS1) TaxID=930990 RepID=A0A067MX09_BOTB1|nr:hypothetical protein BOTBODRAFT_27567 [Botryobasidium botryosum FD-172 SS1]